MSYADQVFRRNCEDILKNGVWDTELAVRPRWEDGTPAHTVKKFGVVNRYDLRKGIPHPHAAPHAIGRARWTSFCGSGRKKATTSATSPPTSGTLGG